MAGFAGNVDLRPLGAKGIAGGVEVLFKVGGVAVCALIVPVLIDAGPMQIIAGFEFLIWVEVEPALAALFFRARVPSDAERLQAATREFDQVLLQWSETKGVFDFKVGELAVRAIGINKEFIVAGEKVRRHAVVTETYIIEIAQHAFVRGDLHSHIVVRTFPQVMLLGVTTCAGVPADITQCVFVSCCHRRAHRRRRIANGFRGGRCAAQTEVGQTGCKQQRESSQ